MFRIFVIDGLLLFIAPELQSHDFKLEVILVVLQCHSFVELLLCNLGFLLILLLQLLIALFVNFCFNQFVPVAGIDHTEFRQVPLNVRRCYISLSQIGR